MLSPKQTPVKNVIDIDDNKNSAQYQNGLQTQPGKCIATAEKENLPKHNIDKVQSASSGKLMLNFLLLRSSSEARS